MCLASKVEGLGVGVGVGSLSGSASTLDCANQTT